MSKGEKRIYNREKGGSVETVFARASTPVAPPCLTLTVVYGISSDPSYDVTRTDSGRRGYVALRNLEGEGLLKLKGSAPLLLRREGLVFFRNAEIERYFCSAESWNFWWFEFECGGELDFPLDTALELSLDPGERQAFKTCLGMLREDSPLSTPLASLAFSQLYHLWVKRDRERSEPYSPYRDGIFRAIERMQSHLKEPFRVGEAASQLGLGERRFHQIFKAIVGETPKRYFEGLRGEAAEDFLARSSFSVADIAERLGYSSPYHFSRAFSKFRALSPSAYRKSRSSSPRQAQPSPDPGTSKESLA